jgi:hypothetical protein
VPVSAPERSQAESSRTALRVGITLLVLWVAVVVVYTIWQLARGAHG